MMKQMVREWWGTIDDETGLGAVAASQKRPRATVKPVACKPAQHYADDAEEVEEVNILGGKPVEVCQLQKDGDVDANFSDKVEEVDEDDEDGNRQ